MGQKTNPKGFRLITTQSHLSNWYSNNKVAYSSLIEEDYALRKKIVEDFSKVLSIADIDITRGTNDIKKEGKVYTYITIHALYPRARDIQKILVKNFSESEKALSLKYNEPIILMQDNLKEAFCLLLNQKISLLTRALNNKTNKKNNVSIKFIENPFQNSTLICKYVASELEKRVPFRRVLNQVIKKVQLTSAKGLKIQVSGRLNGIDIARSEWKREGRIPLHTLDANIDYAHYNAKTIYGLIGIKVWLFID
jgi:small subunit ribosomal protein S3